MRRPSTRAVAAGLLLVTLLIAGVLSRYASSEPDGLTKVSQEQGFADTETEHATSSSPFAGYDGALAGVVGVVVVLALGGGLTLALRRRRPEPAS